MTKHLYHTTRTVTVSMHWADALTGKETGTPTQFERPPVRAVYTGGRRAFLAHIASLNAQHGDGYAIPE